jgi:cell division septal protein FtsQ
LIPAVYETLFADDRPADGFDQAPGPSRRHPANGAIALIQRSDGFFQIDGSGRLLGPVSPIDAANLPILSGGGVQHAPPAQLIEYATQLIRAEAALSAIISQMRVGSDGRMRLFLDRVHLVIDLAPGQLPLQLARAAKVLAAWHNRREPIAMIDMTIPDQAIVRPPVIDRQQSDRANAFGSVSRPG